MSKTEVTSETGDTLSKVRMVGIAASAGGLEAMSLLAQNLPISAGAIYVVAQHMSPTHKSLLTSLISRETKLPVKEIENEVVPEVDTIYVTPPNKDVVLEKGLIRLREPTGHFASPIPSGDRLFKSLAEHHGENCLGIVLSGTGSDGSYGIQAIREAGGITIAQDPVSAKYDGMPTSAIETGCVDLTMAPDLIGQHLTKILENPRDLQTLAQHREETHPYQNLFSILLARTNVDFREYKKNTIVRRISRRMAALGIESYEDYTERCRVDEAEVEALYRDLLISVTRFFRDPEQFDLLRFQLTNLCSEKTSGQIRVWIVGCATGEEAYSIAITLFELLGGIDAANRGKVRVFATDIDQNAIDIARRGVYPVAAAQDIPPMYLESYFTYGDSEIIVRPEVREAVLFSHHNAFQDPPFVNLDLVSIRNVLIYFNQSLQERVLSRIHYALGQDGVLFLGLSETVGDLSVFFQPSAQSDKILTKRIGASRLIQTRDHAFFSGVRPRLATREKELQHARSEFRFAHEESLLNVVAENGLVCTKEGQLIEIIGDLTPYIQINQDTAGLTSVKILQEPLRSEVQAMIYSSARSRKRSEGRWHTSKLTSDQKFKIKVYPFSRQTGDETIFLIAFETSFESPSPVSLDALPEGEQFNLIRRLEQELDTVREALQQNIEELQTANEELQSANEELQSTNEEFQATNEELETSNEELQSTNEELLTVNEELQVTSAERQELATELEATLLCAPFAMLFADVALMVRRASRPAVELFNFRDLPPSGIHLSQAALPEGIPPLAPLANDVLRLQQTQTISFVSEDRAVSMTVSPVTDVHNKPIGVVILLVPQDGQNELGLLLGELGTAKRIGHWSYEPQSQKFSCSDVAAEIHGAPNIEVTEMNDFLQLIHEADAQRVDAKLKTSLEAGAAFTVTYKSRKSARNGAKLKLVGVPLKDAQKHVQQINGAVWEVEQ